MKHSIACGLLVLIIAGIMTPVFGNSKPSFTIYKRLGGHSGEIQALAFSPDGKYLASSGTDKRLFLWDVSTGVNVREFLGHSGGVVDICFSPDGKFMAIIGAAYNQREHRVEVIVWEVASGKQVFHIGRPYPLVAQTLAFSSDGRYLAASFFNMIFNTRHQSEIVLMSTTNWRVDREIKIEDHIRTLLFLKDGRLLGGGSSRKKEFWGMAYRVVWWDILKEKRLEKLRGHDDFIITTQFGSDGQHLVSGGQDRTLILWDVVKGKKERVFKGYPGAVERVAVSSDNRRIASSGGHPTVMIWDMATGQRTKVLYQHKSGARSLKFSPDGKFLASGGNDKVIYLWNVETGQVVRQWGTNEGSMPAFFFSPDGHFLVSNGGNTALVFWSIPDGRELLRLGAHFSSVNALAMSRDGKYLASASPRRLYGGGAAQCLIWERIPGDVVNFQIKAMIPRVFSTIETMVFSPDGRYLATATRQTSDGALMSKPEVALWEVRPGRKIATRIKTFKGFETQLNRLALSPDGKHLAGGVESRDADIIIWDVTSGAIVQRLKDPASNTGTSHKGFSRRMYWAAYNVKGLAYSPDGKCLASGGYGNRIILWDTAKGHVVRNFEGQTKNISSVTFSPDGKYLASSSNDKTVNLWEVSTGTLLNTLTHQGNNITAIAFSTDGGYLASGSWDGSILLWKIKPPLKP